MVVSAARPRDRFDLAAMLAAVVLVPPPSRTAAWLVVVLAGLAAVVVVVPEMRRSPWPWAIFAVAHGSMLVAGWYRLDNHDFLIFYLALALALAATAADPESTFGTTARWLVGLTFALATAWKLGSGQFHNGDFFRHALLLDPRFASVADWVSGVGAQTAAANVSAVQAAMTSPQPTTVVLAGAREVGGLAALLTGYGIVLEGAIAVAFLGPDRPAWRPVRSATLLAFLATTYLVVPVIRFGLTLALLGVAQAHGRWRTAFLVAVPALVVWGPLWTALTA